MAGWDKRSYIRYNSEGKLLVTLENDPTKTFQGELIDISFSGFSGFFKENIAIGTIVQFNLTLDLTDENTAGKAQVKSFLENKRYGQSFFRIGFEFTEVEKNTIQDLVNKIQIKICDEAKKRWETKPKNQVNPGPL